MKTPLLLAIATVTLSTGFALAQGGPSIDPAAVRAGVYALDRSHAKVIWGTSHFGFSTAWWMTAAGKR